VGDTGEHRKAVCGRAGLRGALWSCALIFEMSGGETAMEAAAGAVLIWSPQ
jgi:hypothetical protein